MSNDPTPKRSLYLRIESFANDPLHSAANLSGLNSYLTNEDHLPGTYTANQPCPSQSVQPFLFRYDLAKHSFHKPIIHSNVEEFQKSTAITEEGSELVFIIGYPSRQWLRAVLHRFGLDYRFLHSHLDFLPGAHREWYIRSSVPSRQQHSIRLLVPSMIFLEPESRRIAAKDLHHARNSCKAKLKGRIRQLFGGSTLQYGQSIVREINMHSGDILVLEQALSVSVVKSEHGMRSKVLK